MQASGDDKIVGPKGDQCERNDNRRWNWQPIHSVKAYEHGPVDREARDDHESLVHIRPPSKVDACRHETPERNQAEEITNDFESPERGNRSVHSLGSMNDHERTDRNDQDRNDDRHYTETTMQVRSVRRHQT